MHKPSQLVDLYIGRKPFTTPTLVLVEDIYGLRCRMLAQPGKDHQGEPVDAVALAALHNSVLREQLQQNAPHLYEHVEIRIHKHMRFRGELRGRIGRGGFPKTFSINSHYPKENFPIHVCLYNSGSSWVSGIGSTGRNNQALVDAADRLARMFEGRYRVEADSAWFDQISDAEKFIHKVWSNRDSDSRAKDKVWVDISRTLMVSGNQLH